MKFSFPAFFTTILAVVLSGSVSFVEGTFTSKKVTMGFLHHAGMWSDLIFVSTAIGFSFPYFVKNNWALVLSFLVAGVVTVSAHAKWAEGLRAEGVTEHMFPSHQTGVWYKDISASGWTHVGVMTLLFTAVVMYALSPAPPRVVVVVSMLLTAHVFVGCIVPGWYCTGKLWTRTNFVPPVCMAAVVWSVAVMKMQLTKGRM